MASTAESEKLLAEAREREGGGKKITKNDDVRSVFSYLLYAHAAIECFVGYSMIVDVPNLHGGYRPKPGFETLAFEWLGVGCIVWGVLLAFHTNSRKVVLFNILWNVMWCASLLSIFLARPWRPASDVQGDGSWCGAPIMIHLFFAFVSSLAMAGTDARDTKVASALAYGNYLAAGFELFAGYHMVFDASAMLGGYSPQAGFETVAFEWFGMCCIFWGMLVGCSPHSKTIVSFNALWNVVWAISLASTYLALPWRPNSSPVFEVTVADESIKSDGSWAAVPLTAHLAFAALNLLALMGGTIESKEKVE